MVDLDLSLAAHLRAEHPSFSFEFFPPKDDEGEEVLWRTISELEPLDPTFVSVTYGAGGTSQERTVRITARIAEQTRMRAIGHLTLVAQSKGEIESVLKQYAAAGIDHVLALRGDPKGGPRAVWEPHPDGMTYALDLVELAGDLGGFCIGVAAFPEGHPDAESIESDAEVLVAKARAGAEYAITQLFFRSSDYFTLVDRVRALGCDIPIIPGIMPILNFGQVARMAELSGAEIPREVLDEIEPIADDKVAVRAKGIELATQLCRDLLAGGAPGLHFITLNRSKATREIFETLRERGTRLALLYRGAGPIASAIAAVAEPISSIVPPGWAWAPARKNVLSYRFAVPTPGRSNSVVQPCQVHPQCPSCTRSTGERSWRSTTWSLMRIPTRAKAVTESSAFW